MGRSGGALSSGGAVALLASLLAVAGGARAEKLLVLPVVEEGADAARAAQIQAGLDAATADVVGVLEVVPAAGPTFCGSLDEGGIAAAGQAAGAAIVLHTAARPVGGTLSALFVLVPTSGGPTRKEAETIGAGVPAGPLVRSAVVRLVAPARWTGGLDVEASDGSELWVDGAKLGVTPLAAPLAGLPPGQRALRVVRPGGAEARSLVEIRYATVTRVKIEARSDLMEVVGFDAAASVGGAPVDVATGPREHGVAPAAREDGVRGSRIGQGVTAGLGVVALGAGALFALQAADAEAGLAGLQDADGNYPPGSGAERSRLLDDLDGNGTRATISFAAGGALLVGAAVWWWLDDEPAPAATASLAVAPGQLVFTGTF